MSFAPDRERDENGWIQYPRDTTARRHLYSKDLADRIMTHPAKQNAHLCMDVVEFVSKPGETILDPFGGVGTTLFAATMGRRVTLVELETYYHAIIMDSIKELEKQGCEGMMAIQSDNRLALPIPCDHIITSPPYGNDLAKESEEAALTAEIGKQGMQYTSNNQNLGKMSTFYYNQLMKKVYELMVKSVRPGGTITITHRDRMRAGERVMYIDSITGTLVRLGMKVKHFDKWKPPGSFAARVNEKLGAEIVEDEDILIFEKGQ